MSDARAENIRENCRTLIVWSRGWSPIMQDNQVIGYSRGLRTTPEDAPLWVQRCTIACLHTLPGLGLTPDLWLLGVIEWTARGIRELFSELQDMPCWGLRVPTPPVERFGFKTHLEWAAKHWPFATDRVGSDVWRSRVSDRTHGDSELTAALANTHAEQAWRTSHAHVVSMIQHYVDAVHEPATLTQGIDFDER